MSDVENEGFLGFDRQWVEPASPDVTAAADPVAWAVRVEEHVVSRGSAHADRLTEEMTLSTVDGRMVDLSESVAEFSAVTRRQQQYSTVLCDRVADHAAELRAAVTARDRGLPFSYKGPIYAAATLADRRCLDLAAALDGISGRLSSRAGIALPQRLRESGWSPEVPSAELRARAARLGSPRPAGTPSSEPVVQPRPAWLPARIGFRW